MDVYLFVNIVYLQVKDNIIHEKPSSIENAREMLNKFVFPKTIISKLFVLSQYRTLFHFQGSIILNIWFTLELCLSIEHKETKAPLNMLFMSAPR